MKTKLTNMLFKPGIDTDHVLWSWKVYSVTQAAAPLKPPLLPPLAEGETAVQSQHLALDHQNFNEWGCSHLQ